MNKETRGLDQHSMLQNCCSAAEAACSTLLPALASSARVCAFARVEEEGRLEPPQQIGADPSISDAARELEALRWRDSRPAVT